MNVPPSRPQADRANVSRRALRAWAAGREGPLPEFFVYGERGYYLDTMGRPGANDRGIYDDAIFVVSPNAFASFNANVDPSVFRPGIATLRPGVYPYRRGRHGVSRDRPGRIVSYPAFRPATPGEQLPVSRDGIPAGPRPGVAINIHRGGLNSTSSEGCQTIHPRQWDSFYHLVDTEMSRLGLKTFDYILAENS